MFHKFLGLLIASSLLLLGCSSPEPVAPTPTYSEGQSCSTLGKQQVTDSGIFECRYSGNGKLQFVLLTGEQIAPQQVQGLSDINLCKLSDYRPMDGQGGQSSGQAIAFPVINNRIPAKGEIKVGIVPIDFPNAPSTESITDLIQPHLDEFDDWLAFTSGGLVTYDWVVPQEWLRMPLPAEYYNWDHPYVNPDGSYRFGDAQLQSDDQMATQVFSEAEKIMDLGSFNFLWVVVSPTVEQVAWAPQGSPRNVVTANGTYLLNYFGLGHKLWVDQASRLPVWSIMAHEMLHAHGLALHAPGNGYQLHIGNTGTVLGAWDSFLLGWRPDSSFACVDASSSAVNVDLDLSSIDSDDQGYKAALIKVSENEILVVESRRSGPFSSAISEGAAGLMTYLVNTSVPSLRFDGDFSREKDYFAYFLPIDKPHKSNIRLGNAFLSQSQNQINLATDKVAFEGDSFSFGGIKITLKNSQDFDSINVLK